MVEEHSNGWSLRRWDLDERVSIRMRARTSVWLEVHSDVVFVSVIRMLQ